MVIYGSNNDTVRVWFWFLSPNDEWVKAQRAPYNEFVESGLKS